MRRSAREDLAPAEIMDTSVSITLAQKDAATATVYRMVRDEGAASEIISALGLDANDNIIVKK